jgi:putative FmdB family regulatory protein
MPMYDFTCSNDECGHHITDYLCSSSEVPTCEKCGAAMVRDLSAHGGYNIKGDNGASRRPRGAGSFKGGK